MTGIPTIISITMATGFWFLESFVHSYIYEEGPFELFPQDPDQLWMKIIIFTLILLFGVLFDFQKRKLRIKEEEKLKVFKATVRSSQHILNNHLNQMQLFMLKAENLGLINHELKTLYADSLTESCNLLTNLSQIEKPTEAKIEESVQPWLKSNSS